MNLKRVTATRRLSGQDLDDLDSQHQLELVLNGLGNSSGGQWHRLTASKYMTLAIVVTIPSLLLLGAAIYFMADSVVGRSNILRGKNVIEESFTIGKLVDVLQKERDQSVLYAGAIGPQTQNYLRERYHETDELLKTIIWPTGLDKRGRAQFKTYVSFQRYLAQHRTQVFALEKSIFREMNFYTEIIKLLINWLFETFSQSRYTGLWKALVAFQKVISAKEDVGIERALGVFFFANGGFEDITQYTMFTKQVNIFRYRLRTALKYSTQEAKLYSQTANSSTAVNIDSLTVAIEELRWHITNENITDPSITDATEWFELMTLYMEQLNDFQGILQVYLIDSVSSLDSKMLASTIVSVFVLLIVVSVYPFIIKTLYRMTSDIQLYAVKLVDRNKELRREKKRTDSLLYQMLPRTVAEQLKHRQQVNAEYFKDVTIFFSDICGFTEFTRECPAMDLVEALNQIYVMFDERIEKHNVYKVETIGDSYMVAAGLPTKDPGHASEIANMALDLLEASATFNIDTLPGIMLKLRIGIHSGPAMAGIVGSKLPRYCVFGDTVNTASRMETHGEPNKIHIGNTTYRMLRNSRRYVLRSRGIVNIKGKGDMRTYWLLGRIAATVQTSDIASMEDDNDYALHLDPEGTVEIPGIVVTNGESRDDVTTPTGNQEDAPPAVGNAATE